MKQLPDALDLMSRGLTVGHPLNVTVNSVAQDMPDPIGSEFGIIQDQVSYGEDIVTAFSDFADRVEIEDASYLAVSVGIQHGTGGNLARVLQVLSKVIRDRATMRQRIHAISAEGRLSAMILTLLPFVIFGSIQMSTPSYYGDVSTDPLFKPFAIAIIGLILAQGIILNRLVNFKF
jgi:tight adherence protein B